MFLLITFVENGQNASVFRCFQLLFVELLIIKTDILSTLRQRAIFFFRVVAALKF